MAKSSKSGGFFDTLKSKRHVYSSEKVAGDFKNVDRQRVEKLATELSKYIGKNLPAAFDKRNALADYRTNPYVLMTAANVVNLHEASAFASFLFNSKLYMALETSFGKSIEAAFVSAYPLGSEIKWSDASEKIDEFKKLENLSREDKAKARTSSVWREIDKAVVVGSRRYMTSIKSGPNTINDTQVQGMTQAIITNHRTWLSETKKNHSSVKDLDIVLGLTYGTDKTTNNKENQVLAKLLDQGFFEEDREKYPGVLLDKETKSTRVYRRIGMEFWDFIGSPQEQGKARFVYFEILLGLARALARCITEAELETRINIKMKQLAEALGKLTFARNTLPEWVAGEFSEAELFWFATAMTAFYDEGI